MKKSRIINKDLNSLIEKYAKNDVISSFEKNYSKDNIKLIKNQSIDDNGFVSLAQFPFEEVESISKSLKENGFYNPIIVRSAKDHYEVILGRKRLIACKSLGIFDVPCIIHNMSDEETLLTMLADCRERRDANPYEIALILNELHHKFNYKNKDLSLILKQSPSQITSLIKILNLPQEILINLNEGKITYGHLKSFSMLNHEEAYKVYKYIIDNSLSVRQTERYVRLFRKQKEEKKGNPNLIIKENQIILYFSSKDELKKAKKVIKKLIKKGDIVL